MQIENVKVISVQSREDGVKIALVEYEGNTYCGQLCGNGTVVNDPFMNNDILGLTKIDGEVVAHMVMNFRGERVAQSPSGKKKFARFCKLAAGIQLENETFNA